MPSTFAIIRRDTSRHPLAQRGEGEATVAADDRGDAVHVRRRRRGIPEELRVVVGVRVDDAGDDEQAGRIDDARLLGASSVSPTTTIRPSRIPTSARRGARPVPSTTVPPWINRSSTRGSRSLQQRSDGPSGYRSRRSPARGRSNTEDQDEGDRYAPDVTGWTHQDGGTRRSRRDRCAGDGCVLGRDP